MSEPFQIRSAQTADQKVIRQIVRQSRINPFGTHWGNFLVAEVDGQIAGIGQIKIHGDGSRELASIAVRPEFRRQGIASAIIDALLAGEDRVLYLTCMRPMEGFYQPFGFRRATGADLSPYMARLERLNQWFKRAASLVTSRQVSGIIMRRDP
jgi:N-acetylglutamate synthase-like GNAT family acetyltransferase